MMDFETLHAAAAAHGQEHIFSHWETLDAQGQAELLACAAQVDFPQLSTLINNLVLKKGNGNGKGKGADASAPAGNGSAAATENLQPAPYTALPENGGDPAAWEAAYAAGEEALRKGRVAAFTVAGGQGTRLGFEGPKGTFPITPYANKTLFEVFADKIACARETYGINFPWLIMTSQLNHLATQEFFKANAYFGLGEGSVHFFSQGLMPAVTEGGGIILETPSKLAMSPDGHGGALTALNKSGHVQRLLGAGIDTLAYFQVDNPLVNVLDPAFIGWHLNAGSQLSSKMVPKRSAAEKVGVFCSEGQGSGGVMRIIEYSNMPAKLAEAVDENASPLYNAGSIAVHMFNLNFIHNFAHGTQLPFHLAHKNIPTINGTTPGIKFEQFVFDALPLAKNPTLIEASRAEEFSPVKNAQGADSPETCQADMLAQAKRWLQAAGSLEANVEISYRFANTQRTFAHKWSALDTKLTVKDGEVLG